MNTQNMGTVHMFGRWIDGKLYRYEGEFSEEEFTRLTRYALPPLWVAWHKFSPNQWARVYTYPVAPSGLSAQTVLEVFCMSHSKFGICAFCKCQEAHGVWVGMRWIMSNEQRRLIPVRQKLCLACASDIEYWTGRSGHWIA